MATCPALSTGDAFLSTLLNHIDCQAQTIGTMGYQALANPGSPFAMVLTALLTIFIALFGLRMVLGDTPTLRDGVMAVVKIGVVLLIATSWPAYRTLVYDVIVDGPGQLGAAIGRSAGVPGTSGDLIDRLQTSDVAISRLTTLGSGLSDLTSKAPAASNISERAPIADDAAFGSARILFLSATVAAFAVVRLMAGILLALAPLFAGLVLFDLATGLFVGWLRALAFTLFASVAVTIILGVELALLEPWLTQVLQLRHARIITAAAPIELLVLCLAFALALVGALALSLRLAFTNPLPLGQRIVSMLSPTIEQLQPIAAAPHGPERSHSSPRAQAVASALIASQRRERAQSSSGSSMTIQHTAARARSTESTDGFAIPSFGQALRRTRQRKSTGAALRDRRS
tara:strand:- start:43345 stop:44547 length:1203 start_codon:yes stop_codon:yes gene_type:complete